MRKCKFCGEVFQSIANIHKHVIKEHHELLWEELGTVHEYLEKQNTALDLHDELKVAEKKEL